MKIHYQTPVPHLCLLYADDAPTLNGSPNVSGIPNADLENLVAVLPIRMGDDHIRATSAAQLLSSWSEEPELTAQKWRLMHRLLEAAPPGPWSVELGNFGRRAALLDADGRHFGWIQHCDASPIAARARQIVQMQSDAATWLNYYRTATDLKVGPVVLDVEHGQLVADAGRLDRNALGEYVIARTGQRVVDLIAPEAAGHRINYLEGDAADLRRHRWSIDRRPAPKTAQAFQLGAVA